LARSSHEAHARFRFSVIGSLLSSPPESGALRRALQELARRTWRHPITGEPTHYAFSTIERWYYTARDSSNPVEALRSAARKDRGTKRSLSSAFMMLARQQYQQHPSWTLRLHYDNLEVVVQAEPSHGPLPSYPTYVRFMRAQGLRRQRPRSSFRSPGEARAYARREEREIRSYEVDHVAALWHLDFHGARHVSILTREGERHKPQLVALLDDHSRLCLHAQFYFSETAEDLVHATAQALLKRGLPRAILSDNGAAMTSEEFTEGLARLSIQHQRTLSYSPYQNGKQEHFWSVVEGRFLAMLEGVSDLTLDRLNALLQAWVEREYNRRFHSEIRSTPIERYQTAQDVSRPAPTLDTLRDVFRRQVARKPRTSDDTFTLEGTRFQIPLAYRHLSRLVVRYARWDLTFVHLVDEHSDRSMVRVFPLDRSRNAEGLRRRRDAVPVPPPDPSSNTLPALLEKLVQDYAATGLAPSYLVKPDSQSDSTKGNS